MSICIHLYIPSHLNSDHNGSCKIIKTIDNIVGPSSLDFYECINGIDLSHSTYLFVNQLRPFIYHWNIFFLSIFDIKLVILVIVAGSIQSNRPQSMKKKSISTFLTGHSVKKINN